MQESLYKEAERLLLQRLLSLLLLDGSLKNNYTIIILRFDFSVPSILDS